MVILGEQRMKHVGMFFSPIFRMDSFLRALPPILTFNLIFIQTLKSNAQLSDFTPNGMSLT